MGYVVVVSYILFCFGSDVRREGPTVQAFHPKTKTESVSETLFYIKNRALDNVKKHNNCKIEFCSFYIPTIHRIKYSYLIAT
jgi:hypothetical protein